ncbi:MAG: VacJ family lipoprotein [Alphaproteobacteria bacterium]|nr:VacJ family lipoprotein [Alphaproteobacteria bacterium]MDD9920322.1 VacJ family lipoprotein [Alphaproteobacteria bacterium]
MKRHLLIACLVTVSAGFSFNAFADGSSEAYDPWEGYNRAVFSFNEGVDNVILKPLSKGYRAIAPEPVETGVSNFFDNLFYPTTIINQLLQGKPKLAVQDTMRFILNSTVGILGFMDVAKKIGFEEHSEDFGQTLAVWGVGDGPYMVLPILGPSSVRGSVGWVGDYFTNPVSYIEDNETRYALLGTSIIDTRAELLKAESIITGDKYTFMRDAYLQRRKYLINDQMVEENDPFLDQE